MEALTLALSAPSDAKAEKCMKMAQLFQASCTKEEIKMAKFTAQINLGRWLGLAGARWAGATKVTKVKSTFKGAVIPSDLNSTLSQPRIRKVGKNA